MFTKGNKHTEATKSLIKIRWASKARRQKQREVRNAYLQTPEGKALIESLRKLHLGKPLSATHKQRISQSLKARYSDPQLGIETRRKQSIAMKERGWSDEELIKMGKLNLPEQELKHEYLELKLPVVEIMKRHNCGYQTVYRYLQRYSIPLIQSSTPSRAARQRQHWLNPECARRMMQSRHTRPTKPELQLTQILKQYFPSFKYNGAGDLGIALAGMIPDFVNVNGKKEVIELFGDYWHSTHLDTWRKTELGRIMAYNSVGYKCLIIWEYELKDTNSVIDKIRQFECRR